MKFKIMLSVFVLSYVFVLFAQAHPPATVDLTYDLETKILTVAGKHQTDDPEEDYLKKMVFSVNDEVILTEYFQRQNSRLNFSKDIAIAAEGGDKISVKIYSAEGGTKTVFLTVKTEEQEGDQVKDMAEEMDASIQKTAGPTTNGYSSESRKGSGY